MKTCIESSQTCSFSSTIIYPIYDIDRDGYRDQHQSHCVEIFLD